ncbi:DUF4386 family protein [Clostridium sp. Marseille-P2415]|uniref:DUF4386 family protein n=1 Tax=Clostridium sp. Marseille-P2415 TaxID=1805471 RepID=UPI0009884704
MSYFSALVFAALCYLATDFANLLLPNYENFKAIIDTVLSAPMAIGELSLAFWLLLKGGKRHNISSCDNKAFKLAQCDISDVLTCVKFNDKINWI